MSKLTSDRVHGGFPMGPDGTAQGPILAFGDPWRMDFSSRRT